MKYKALYKCRLCGAEYFAPTYTTDQDTAATCMTFANAGVRGANHMQPTLTGTHVCAGDHAVWGILLYNVDIYGYSTTSKAKRKLKFLGGRT